MSDEPLQAPTNGRPVVVFYRNHRGETAWRSIIPTGWRWGASEWHPEPQWLIECYDVQKMAPRTYAAKDVLQWEFP